MAYRSQRFIDNSGGRDLLHMALDLHGHVTGAADVSDHKEMAEALREAVATWKPSGPFTLLFDSCVYTLIRSALGEYDDSELRKVMSSVERK